MLYRVVEKAMRPNRRGFEQVHGVWHDDLEKARVSASWIAQTTLAHRLFIVKNVPSEHPVVVEEIDLAPLKERIAASDRSVLATRDPARLARELAHDQTQPLHLRRLVLTN